MKRNMLNRLLSLVLVVVMLVGIPWAVSAEEEDYDKSQSVYVMGSAHIDTLWDWLPAETVDYIYHTWASTLQLLEENEDYKFNASTAKHYMMLWEYYPEMREQILEYYREGRIGNAGFYLQSDVNMPSAESLIRQGLYGQKFYLETFGEKATTQVTPDNFGIGWILPQISLGTGYTQIVGWRAGIDASNFFNWVGPDGSSIPFYHSSVHYFGTTPSSDVKQAMDGVASLGLTKALYFSGVGDRGGGPTQDMLDWIDDLNNRDNYPQITWSLYEDFFEGLTEEDLEKITLDYASGVYLASCQGTFTTQAAIKKYNRDSEVLVNKVESASVMADWLGSSAYPSAQLEVIWDKLMTNQFHDALPGTSIYEANQQIWNDYEILLNMLNDMQDTATDSINSRIDTSGEGVPLVVYNSLSVSHTNVVETTVTFDAPTQGLKLYDTEGNEIPVQITGIDGNTVSILFVAEKVPSMGYAVYHVVPSEAVSYTTDLSLDGYVMENEYLVVEVSEQTGNIKRIYDKSLGREVLAEGEEVELVLLTDTCNAWDLNNTEMAAAPAARLGQDAECTIEIIEQGPVRTVIRVTRTYHTSRSQIDSTYVQDITLYSGINRVEVNNTIDWNERNMILKVSVPTAASNKKATYDLSNGVCTRTVNNAVHSEVYGVKWADISDGSGDFGVSLMNNSRYGYDMPNSNTLRLSLLRSARDQDKVADVGIHEVSYSIYSHAGAWNEGGTQLASYEYNYPLTAVQTTNHDGDLPASMAFMTVDSEDVIVIATKLAEETIDSYDINADSYGSKIAFRLMELNGKNDVNVNVTFASQILSAKETNMLEETTGDVSINGSTLSTTLDQYEIKTFVVSLEAPHYELDRPIVTTVNLNQAFNIRGITLNHEIAKNAIAGMFSLPAEQTPESFMTDGITFRMGGLEEGVYNAISAQGQSVALPGEKYDALYLLACATGIDEDITEVVTIHYTDGSSEKVTLRFEDWNKYSDWTTESKEIPIGLTYNHYHDSGEDAVESRVNLNTYGIRLDENKTVHSMTLPDNSAITVFAVSMANNARETDARFDGAGVVAVENGEDDSAQPSNQWMLWVVIAGAAVLVAVVVIIVVARKQGKGKKHGEGAEA